MTEIKFDVSGDTLIAEFPDGKKYALPGLVELYEDPVMRDELIQRFEKLREQIDSQTKPE